jgi:hypothetical protein
MAMRALCGAIITAGAMIALGLVALGFGLRYHTMADNRLVHVHLDDMDRPLLFMLVFATGVAIIGLGLAFVGLAYHHKRRTDELALAHHHYHVAQQQTATGG